MFDRIQSPGKAVGLLVVGLLLSALFAAQSASNARVSTRPDLAVQINPWNGQAKEKLAFTLFQSSVASTGPVASSAGVAEPIAADAYRSFPLAPDALAVIAQATQTPSAKTNLIMAASQINRRSALLQGSLLEHYLLQGDFDQSVAVLNELLKVNPEQQQQFMPLLVTALRDERAVPEFKAILGPKTAWTNDFLRAAANDPEAVSNLVKLRSDLGPSAGIEPETDQSIMEALARDGDYRSAYEVYKKFAQANASRKPCLTRVKTGMDWCNDLAPFEWSFTDEQGKRAQRSLDERRLEIRLERGKGGVLAERVIPAPKSGELSVDLAYELDSMARADALRLALSCASSKTPFYDKAFEDVNGPLRVSAKGCDLVKITLSGRAWSSLPDIRGEVVKLKVK